MARKLTTETFIEKAKSIHGDRFDYSKVEYTTVYNEVLIGCPVHGFYLQSPAIHFASNGCKECSRNNLAEMYKGNTEDFVEKAQKIHGDRYDYTSSNYIRSHKKLEIICSKHGSFWQTPGHHLSGKGCRKCSLEKNKTARLFSQEKIISDLELKFPQLDFSKFVYVNSRIPSTIICPVHGEFQAEYHAFMLHSGCPKCVIRAGYSRTGYKEMCNGRPSYVYLIAITTSSDLCLKIGISVDPMSRYRGLRYEGLEVVQLNIMKFQDSDNTFDMERYLHKELKDYQYKPQHSFAGESECFQHIPEVIDFFQKIKDNQKV